MNTEKAKILLFEPGKYARIIEVENRPSGLVKAIGGEFDITYPFGNDLCVVKRADAVSANLEPNRAIRKPDVLKEMSYGELTRAFRAHEERKGSDHLRGYIVFTQDSFTRPYSEAARTYEISSNNKAFLPGMGGYSIYGSSLDGSDVCVRLEAYMAAEHGGKDGWKIERCYLIEPGKEILEVVAGPFLICDGSDQRIKSLSEADLYQLKDKYIWPDRITEADGQIQAEAYRPRDRSHER